MPSEALGQQNQNEGHILDGNKQTDTSAGAENDSIKARNNASQSRRTPELAGNTHEDETELPSSAASRAIAEQDTPRRGILFSSPSKRPPVVNDSLKKLSVKPIATLLQKSTSARLIDGPVTDELKSDITKESSQTPNPELERRKQERAQLLQELEQLEDQVTQCAREIHEFQSQTKTVPMQSSDRDNLVWVPH